MTEVNPAGWFQNAGATHTASQMRMYVAGLLNQFDDLADTLPLRPKGGVHPRESMMVTATSPTTMSINVGRGIAYITGTEAQTQGVYCCVNDGTVNLVIAPSDPSLTRIDLIIARVRDTQYSGALNTWVLEVVTGTPGGGTPAVPTNSAVLATVTVNATVTVITSGNITYTLKRFIAGVGGFESWFSEAQFTAASPEFTAWYHDKSDFRYPFKYFDPTQTFHGRFLTTVNSDVGLWKGKIYRGTATLYTNTTEAAVTNLNVPSFSLGNIGGHIFGSVKCFVRSTVANDRVTFRVRDGAPSGNIRFEFNDFLIPVANTLVPIEFRYYFAEDTGTSGPFDLQLTCQRSSGTGTISVIGKGGANNSNFSWHLLSKQALNDAIFVD